MRVQMLVHISGGRGDGRDWPELGGVIDVGDEEARDLVRAKLARADPDEERAVAPDDTEKRPAPSRARAPKTQSA